MARQVIDHLPFPPQYDAIDPGNTDGPDSVIKPRHGGARKGAGRPALPEPHKRRNIYLAESEWAQLARIDPSPSHAISKLLKAHC